MNGQVRELNRIKRIAMQLIENHADMFSDDYEKNKEVLRSLAVIRSKQLRNEIVGYITAYMSKSKEEEVEETSEQEISENAQ